MGIVIQGTGSQCNIESQVDSTHNAGRVNVRPLEHVYNGNIGGHYVLAATFSNTAGLPAAGSQIFSVRWVDTVRLMVLKRIAISVGISTNFGAIQVLDYDVIRLTGFSSSTTGGTSIAPSSVSQKARTSNMSSTLFSANGGIVISSGTALSPGTQTADTQPFGYAMALVQSAISPVVVAPSSVIPLYEVRDMGQHPMVLGANEGFAIRNSSAYGATGVVKHGIIMEWVEVANY